MCAEDIIAVLVLEYPFTRIVGTSWLTRTTSIGSADDDKIRSKIQRSRGLFSRILRLSLSALKNKSVLRQFFYSATLLLLSRQVQTDDNKPTKQIRHTIS